MSKQTINIGTSANDRSGDSLRSAFAKVNANFTELYTALGLDSGGLNLGAFEFTGSTISTTDSSGITIDQATTVTSDLTVSGDILPSVANGGNLGSSANPWRSLYVSNNTIFIGGSALKIDSNGDLTLNNNRIVQENGEFLVLDNLTDVSANSPSVGDVLAWNGSSWVNAGQGGTTGDITFANSTVTAGNDDEIIVQAKDTNGFATARLNLEPVYGETSLSAYSGETVETFTLANGDFATGVWQDNGYGNGVVAFTGAQDIGDFFQNTLMSLTADNVSITINSEPAFTWNGGTNGPGSSTPGFGTSPITPPSPITITSIVFRYRTQSKISVNQGNTEIRLTAQDASIEMSADQNVRVFADNQIEIQSGDTLSISAGESISISNGSSDSISISTGDLNITAFDDVNFRGSDSFRLRNTSATAPIRIITDDNNTQRTWAFNPDGNLTLPGNLHSEGDISIEINLADSTRRIWRFGEDGDLAFPDGTSQSSAGISAISTDTLTNKTINIQAGQGNVFQIQGNSITSYSGSGAVLALTSMPTFSGMNVNNSSLSMDGGSGSYYWAPTFADGAGTIHKAGVYKSANNANNALFTFGANGAGTMSVVMDGSLFIGSALPANNGGLNTDYGGWLVVQAGAKFGGDLNTIGNFILDTPGNYVRFGDGTTQTTAADFGYLDLDKDTIKGTAGYQYTFATDGYFTSSTSSESTNYFFVAYNTTNTNIAAGWTVVGGTANTTVSSVTYPVAGYPGVIRVNLTAAASSTSGFYPVTVTSPDRLRVEIQPNPSTSDKFAFTTSGLTFPDSTIQTTAYPGPQTTLDGDVTGSVFADDSTLLVDGVSGKIVGDVETARLRTTDPNIALGIAAGETNQGVNTIAIGAAAGQANQGTSSIAIGGQAGNTAQGVSAVALGAQAGSINQGAIAVSLGTQAGSTNQGLGAVAVGTQAGIVSQGNYAVALGYLAGANNQPANSIVINASGSGLDGSAAGFYVNPVRNITGTSILQYDATTGEITHSNEISSEEDISIRVNLTDSTQRVWRFGEDGSLTFPDGTNQTTAFTTSPTLEKITGLNQEVSMILDPGANKLIIGPGTWDGSGYDGLTFTHNADYSRIQATGNDTGGATRDLEIIGGVNLTFSTNWAVGSKITLDPDGDGIIELKAITNVTGVLKIDDGVHEQFQTKADATGVVTHDCAQGHIIYHTSPDDYFTVNLTNLNLASGYATSITVVVEQGATGYGPNALQIGGVAQTINWQGGSLPASPTANGVDVLVFSILNNNGTYVVLAQVTGFNEVA